MVDAFSTIGAGKSVIEEADFLAPRRVKPLDILVGAASVPLRGAGGSLVLLDRVCSAVVMEIAGDCWEFAVVSTGFLSVPEVPKVWIMRVG